MQVQVEWMSRITLKKSTNPNLIYDMDLDKVPRCAGIYVFGRQFGKCYQALYIGRTKNDLHSRLKHHIRKNLQLMKHLDNAKGGSRFVFVGKVNGGSAKIQQKRLRLGENALIQYFLSKDPENHDLANVHGVRIKYDEIMSSGQQPRRFIPNKLRTEARKSRNR